MKRRSRRVLAGAGLALVALMGGACTSSGDEDGKNGTLNVPGVQASLSEILQEHIYLAGLATQAAIHNAGGTESPFFEQAAAALDLNSERLADAIESVYPRNRDAFLESWRSHNTMFMAYAGGVIDQDEAAKTKALEDLAQYRHDFGALVNKLNAKLSADAVAGALEPHIGSLSNVVNLQAARDPGWLAALAAAADEGSNIAIVLTTGIAADKRLKGSVGEGQALLRTTLNTLLLEHIYLTGTATSAALSSGPDSPAYAASAAALDSNSEEFADTIEGVYPGSRDEFLQSWRSHITMFVAYTLGAASGDDAAKTAAVGNLRQYRTDFGALISRLNPEIPADTTDLLLERHFGALTVVVDAQASKKPEWHMLLVEAAAHGPIIANALTDGIIAQKPDDFPL